MLGGMEESEEVWARAAGCVPEARCQRRWNPMRVTQLQNSCSAAVCQLEQNKIASCCTKESAESSSIMQSLKVDSSDLTYNSQPENAAKMLLKPTDHIRRLSRVFVNFFQSSSPRCRFLPSRFLNAAAQDSIMFHVTRVQARPRRTPCSFSDCTTSGLILPASIPFSLALFTASSSSRMTFPSAFTRALCSRLNSPPKPTFACTST